MPFDYDKYQQKCNGMTAEELQKEWENYTRQISSGATSTATSVLFMPLTAGISVVGLGLSAPRIHNARKKREIIEAGLKARGTTHHTRTGDVLAPMAVTGIIGGLTLGLVPPGADSFLGGAVAHGVEMTATQTALTATEAVVVDNARKRSAGELNLDDQGTPHGTRYGSMGIPFLMEQSIPFPQPTTIYGFQSPTATNQDPQAEVAQLDSYPVEALHSKQDQKVVDSFSAFSIQSSPDQKMQTIQPEATDAALFASIPTHNLHDMTPLLHADEETILKMHAMALAMEKREEGNHIELASNQVPLQYDPHEQQTLSTQLLPQQEGQPLQSNGQSHIQSDETISTPSQLDPPQKEEERPLLPPRQVPRSATLPAKLSQSDPAVIGNAPTFLYPSQPSPPYQPQYYSPPNQVGFVPDQQQHSPSQQQFISPPPQSTVVTEPQQYYPPPPQPQYISPLAQDTVVAEPQQYYPPPPQPQHQQRTDSGYSSMYSQPSTSSCSPQTYTPSPNAYQPHTYAPAPNPFSRHSSIPQTYQHPASLARKPVPPHNDPNLYNPQVQMQQGHRNSETSVYPMTSPPPYHPPPGTSTAPSPAIKQNDYFNQSTAPSAPPATKITSATSSPLAFNPLLEKSQKMVDGMNKGWQWARANALPILPHSDSKKIVEPDYGPPPAVPNAWKGS